MRLRRIASHSIKSTNRIDKSEHWLMERMREVKGTNGGVFIEKEMKDSGTGPSMAACLKVII